MLLVDDDEAHVGQRREQRAAGTDDDARLPAADEVPLVEALALAHARVHDGHRVAEAAAEAPHGLRRERDLGHEHARRAARRKRALDGLKVHLGLARPGDAVHDHDLARRPLARRVDGGERRRLPGGERRLGAGREPAASLEAPAPAAGHPAQAAAALHAHHALALKRPHRVGHRAELGGELRHAQLSRTQGLGDGCLLHRVSARLERGERGAGHHPAVVHFPHRRLLEPPAAFARAHHARHAPRRREQAHARRQGRDVALREPTRARRALLVEVRAAHRAHDALELGGVDPVKPVALVVLRQLDDEAHRAPPAERDEHGAAHLDGRVALAAVLGHGVGIGRVERLRGYVEDDRCEFHDFQYIPSPGRGRRARQGRTKTARLGRARKLRRRRGSGARPLPGEGASRAERNGDDGKIALANGRQEAASSARRRMRGAGRFLATKPRSGTESQPKSPFPS